MNYEQKYKESLEKARDYFKANQRISELEENDILSDIFPELKESEDEKVRKTLIKFFVHWRKTRSNHCWGISLPKILAWLEKQGETNTQNNKPFTIESDKFYFCIKDYFAGGCYRSKKGDVVLAQNGMNMMGLSPKEASEYFIPINPFKEHVVVNWFEKEREKPQGKSAIEAINEKEGKEDK